MMLTAHLPDGRQLHFPDGTDPAVVQAKVKEMLGQGTTGLPSDWVEATPPPGPMQVSPEMMGVPSGGPPSWAESGFDLGGMAQGAADVAEGILDLPSDAARWMAENQPNPEEFIAGALGGAGGTTLDTLGLPSRAVGAVIPGEDPFQTGAEMLSAPYEQLAQESQLGEFAGSLLPWLMLGPTGAFGPSAQAMAEARQLGATGRAAGAIPTMGEHAAAGARFGAGAGALETGQEITEGEATPLSAVANIGGGAASVAAFSLAHAAASDIIKRLMLGGFAEVDARRLAARAKSLARKVHPDFAEKNASAEEIAYRNAVMAEVNAATEAGDLARLKEIEKAWERREKPVPRPEETGKFLPSGEEPPQEPPQEPPGPPPQPKGPEPQGPPPAAPEGQPGGEVVTFPRHDKRGPAPGETAEIPPKLPKAVQDAADRAVEKMNRSGKLIDHPDTGATPEEIEANNLARDRQAKIYPLPAELTRKMDEDDFNIWRQENPPDDPGTMPELVAAYLARGEIDMARWALARGRSAAKKMGKTPSPAWLDAIDAAEGLFEGFGISTEMGAPTEDRRGKKRPAAPEPQAVALMRNAPAWLKADNYMLQLWANHMASDMAAVRQMNPKATPEEIEGFMKDLETARRATERGVTPGEVPPLPEAKIAKATPEELESSILGVFGEKSRALPINGIIRAMQAKGLTADRAEVEGALRRMIDSGKLRETRFEDESGDKLLQPAAIGDRLSTKALEEEVLGYLEANDMLGMPQIWDEIKDLTDLDYNAIVGLVERLISEGKIEIGHDNGVPVFSLPGGIPDDLKKGPVKLGKPEPTTPADAAISSMPKHWFEPEDAEVAADIVSRSWQTSQIDELLRRWPSEISNAPEVQKAAQKKRAWLEKRDREEEEESKRPLLDRAIERAVRSFQGADEVIAEFVKEPRTDDEVKEFLAERFGGSSGQGGSGLIGGGYQEHFGGKNPRIGYGPGLGKLTTLQGKKLINEARRVLGIRSPEAPAKKGTKTAPGAPAPEAEEPAIGQIWEAKKTGEPFEITETKDGGDNAATLRLTSRKGNLAASKPRWVTRKQLLTNYLSPQARRAANDAAIEKFVGEINASGNLEDLKLSYERAKNHFGIGAPGEIGDAYRARRAELEKPKKAGGPITQLDVDNARGEAIKGVINRGAGEFKLGDSPRISYKLIQVDNNHWHVERVIDGNREVVTSDFRGDGFYTKQMASNYAYGDLKERAQKWFEGRTTEETPSPAEETPEPAVETPEPSGERPEEGGETPDGKIARAEPFGAFTRKSDGLQGHIVGRLTLKSGERRFLMELLEKRPGKGSLRRMRLSIDQIKRDWDAEIWHPLDEPVKPAAETPEKPEPEAPSEGMTWTPEGIIERMDRANTVVEVTGAYTLARKQFGVDNVPYSVFEAMKRNTERIQKRVDKEIEEKAGPPPTSKLSPLATTALERIRSQKGGMSEQYLRSSLYDDLKSREKEITAALKELTDAGLISETREIGGKVTLRYQRPRGERTFYIALRPGTSQNIRGATEANFDKTGMTQSQRDWITSELERAAPQISTTSKDELEFVNIIVPKDGTFEFPVEVTPAFYRTFSGKKLTTWDYEAMPVDNDAALTPATANGTRVKATKTSIPKVGARMPYSRVKATSAQFNKVFKTESGWYTQGNWALDPEAIVSKEVEKAIKKNFDAERTPAKDKALLESYRKNNKDIVELEGYQWDYGKGDITDSVLTFIDEKGNRLNDRTADFDFWQFFVEATEFDQVKTDLAEPSAFVFYKHGKMVGILMPRKVEPGDIIEKGLDSPAPAPTGGHYEASLGDYAPFRPGEERDVHSAHDTAGPPIGATLESPQNTYSRNVFAVAFPEIVQIAKAIGKGQYPKVLKFLGEGVRGRFMYKPGDRKSGRIQLLAEIAGNLEQAAATLAHEIGHWVDFLPEGTMARGNILGRISGLVNYLKHTISQYPTEPVDFLSEKDRERLHKQAEKESKVTYEEEIDEFILKTTGVTPEDVLSIWNMYTPTAPKELIDFIKGLNTAQKKAIIQKAMQGLVADELARFTHQVREYTGKKVKVKKTKFVDVEQKFRTLLFEEMRKRHLVTLEEIWNEVWPLSVLWRPLGDNPSPAFLKYRKNGKEVYADLISAFLNDPALVKQRAPKAYGMLMAWMDRKPEFQTVWQEIQNLLSDPQALQDSRTQGLLEMQARGTEKTLKALVDEPETMTLAQHILKVTLEKKQAWYHARRKAKKNGTYDPAKDPLFDLEAMLYNSSEIAWYLDVVNTEVLVPLREFMNETELGAYLELRRAAVRKEEGGRAELFNPMGIGGEYAQKTIDDLKKRWTPEQQQIILDALENWANLRLELFKALDEAHLFSPKMREEMRDSVHAYGTYHVYDHLEDVPSGWVFPQKGTLQEIGNVFVETLLKDMAMIRLAHRNETAIKAVAWLREHLPENIHPAQKKSGGRYAKFLEPHQATGIDPRRFELLLWDYNGQRQGAYVTKEFAEAFEHLSKLGPTANAFNMVTRFLRAIMVDHNPFWPIWNIQKDARRMALNLPMGKVHELKIGGRTLRIVDPITPLVEATRYLADAFPDAIADVYKDTRSPLIREMFQERALIQTGVRFWKAGDLTEDEASALLLERYGVTPQAHQHLVDEVFSRLSQLLSNPGAVTERVVKVAGYKWLRDHQEELGLTMQEIASITRRTVGTPDIKAGGAARAVYNALFLFSNVALQDTRTSLEALSKDPAVFAQKMFWYTILPKAMMRFGALGLLGATIKAMYDRIPEYDKQNFQCVPFGMYPVKIEGSLLPHFKTIYFRIPQDHFSQAIGALSWEAMKRDDDLTAEMWQLFNASFPFGLGQLNPVIDEAANWLQYLRGQNPRDSYRGRPVIPEAVFKEGNAPKARGYMLRHTWNNLGLQVIWDMDEESVDTVATGLEKMTKLPGLSSFIKRFIKISDYGLQEQIWEDLGDKRESKQATRNERDEAIRELLKKHPTEPAHVIRRRFLQSGVDPGYADDKNHKQLDDRINDLRYRYHGDPWQQISSRVNSKDEKDIVKKNKEDDTKLLTGKRR